MLDRHDLPKSFRDFLDLAVKFDVVDAAEVFCMATAEENGPVHIVHEILEAAFASRHGLKAENRSKLIEQAEAVWRDLRTHL